jgi:hypothetical protein
MNAGKKFAFLLAKKSKSAKFLLQGGRFSVPSPQKSSVTGFVWVYLCVKVVKDNKK